LNLASTHSRPPKLTALESLPLILGFTALAIPTALSLGSQVWSREFGAHGPIVAITGAWLLWRNIALFRQHAVPGNIILVAIGAASSLLLYVFGRAYDFISLEAAGLYGLGVSILYSRFGMKSMLANWFPLFYMSFLIPPPIWLLDHLTAPLKIFASWVATDVLQLFGVPISRQGVTLVVAQYQLLVEDACSGMNSLVGLVAISLFYIYLLRNASWKYSLFLTSLVIPIAIISNIIRIMTLVILTYNFGNAVAQGFLHETAGMILFATSLILVFSIDRIATAVMAGKRR
jgi:exosortase